MGINTEPHRVVPLVWSDPQTQGESCNRSYTQAKTPFGEFRIRWKAADRSRFEVDMPSWFYDDRVTHYWVEEESIKSAKKRVEEEYQRRVLSCLTR